jgi:polyisoprenoid-binding protein YceI
MSKKSVLVLAGLVMLAVIGWFLYNKYRIVIPPVDKTRSEIGWSAKSVSGAHTGKVQLASASLRFQQDTLVGGEFTVDRKSISVEDITDPQHNKDLIQHITTGDFFETSTYPVATSVIKEVKPITNAEFHIKGNMTIKSVTQPIQFKATVLKEENQRRATATIQVDRTKFGIEYGSQGKRGSEKDWFIYDEFTLNVNIVSE